MRWMSTDVPRLVVISYVPSQRNVITSVLH